MMRYVYSVSICLIIAACSVGSAGMASAATSYGNASCSRGIVGGLYEGANAALGTNYGCTQSGSASHTPISQTSTRPSAPAASTNTNTGYYALGDSVAAGLGLPPAGGGDPACGVSTQAYGGYVASKLGYKQYYNLACSGATAGDLVTEQHLSNTSRDIEPQLDRAFAAGTPSLITLTAGANDVYWQTYIQKCYVSTCGTSVDSATAAALLSALKLKLQYAMSSINSRSNGQPPRVVLSGYYSPLSSACTRQQSNVTAGEIKWINGELQSVNSTIRSVVNQYSFARYAPVSFSGHELCSSDSWVQGLTASAPLHPTARGQQVIAQSVANVAR